jgi:hypothetical protein
MPARTKRRRRNPEKAIHVSTYDRLEAYLRDFAQGHFHLLVLVGAGGLAKSRSVRAVMARPRTVTWRLRVQPKSL